MNFIYRNILDQTVRFTLGPIHYAVSPGETVEIPEKYDYAIEGMGVRLEKDYELSIINDARKNPGLWQHFINPEPGPEQTEDVSNKVFLETKPTDTKRPRVIRPRKKKIVDSGANENGI